MSYEVTFTDNAEVTLENMNDIAKDLGDTEFSEFSTNKFGVDTLNSITSDLVSAGILRTETNSNMGCTPIIDGTNVIIGTGVIVFDTGAKLRITEAETFVKANSTYIYAKNDHITGIASIVMSETAPTSQMDAVLLCKIDNNGNLVDLRSSAVSKLSPSADFENVGVTKHINIEIGPKSNVTVDVGFNGWKYVIFRSGESLQYINIIELNDGENTGYFPQRNLGKPSYFQYYVASGIVVTRIGSILSFYNNYDTAQVEIDVEIEVR